MRRAVIVNADDFGLSASVNEGVVTACTRGIVTAASLMVRAPAAADAVALAYQNGLLDLGLHIDLGEWVRDGDDWLARYEVADLEDEGAVRREVEAQLAQFAALGAGTPSHLDSHQHVHRQPVVGRVVREIASRLDVPLRESGDIAYVGWFYGQDEHGQTTPGTVSAAALVQLLRALPEGVHELACHPGYADDLESDYRLERELELQSLCDPVVRNTLADEGIELRQFRPDVHEAVG